MAASSSRLAAFRQSGHVATVVVIGLAYAVTYFGYLSDRAAGREPEFSAAALAAATLLGVVYLALSLLGMERWSAALGRYTKIAYFVVMLALMLAIELLVAGSTGMWLIAMPLVATATLELRGLWRWIVYLIVMAGFALPIYVATGSRQAAFLAVLTFSPAIVFVIVFVQLAERAERAQLEAERLAQQLDAANQSLAAYAVQAEELATTQERNRLAREIHDNLGHYLTVVGVQIRAARAVMERDPARARAALDKAAQLTQEGLDAVRRSVAALRESPLGGRALPEALAALADETQAAGIVTTLSVTGEPRPLDPRVELTLYRAAQEGLTNARRHARASRVDIVLDYTDPDAASLSLRDNGIGADPDRLQPGFGILGLEERARQLGGTLTVETSPGHGFGLCLVVPTVAAETEPVPAR